MRTALVFDGVRSLDFQDIRTNVIRIPEVAARIREAQSIWDTISAAPLDLLNFVGSGDEIFLRHIRLKNFATAVVQVGLMDRYLKKHSRPDFIVGPVNGDSPVNVVSGKTTFFDLVAESEALSPKGAATPADPAGLPFLAGVELAEYGIFQRRSGTQDYLPMPSGACDLQKMLMELVGEQSVERLVTVGPGHSMASKNIEVQVVESIDLDPMLGWFWAHQRDGKLAIAN